MKIEAHRYKAFRESIRGDSLIKLINLMLRSPEYGLYLVLTYVYLSKDVLQNFPTVIFFGVSSIFLKTKYHLLGLISVLL